MIQNNIPLKPFCNYRIGGCGRFFLEVKVVEELARGLEEWCVNAPDDRCLILGAGCNVLIDDAGFEGLVIHNAISFIRGLSGDLLQVGSGVSMSGLLNYCVRHELAGLEWAGGLPGTVGGAVVGNAGAFGGEIKDVVVEVESIDLQTKTQRVRSNCECEFSYRDSIFKHIEPEYIVSVLFKLEAGNRTALMRSIAEKIAYRRQRHPIQWPNIGSIFKNVEVRLIPEKILPQFTDRIKNDPFPQVPAAALLADAGLKGRRLGDIEISSKHPNFFVNLGHGKASEVCQLIRIAQETIQAQFGVALELEVIVLK
jgi:UDP-N-acetylmuramate dehydrogenase